MAPSEGTATNGEIPQEGIPQTAPVRLPKNRMMTFKKCVIVAFGFLMMMLTIGFLVGLGVLFVEIIETFQSTRATGSLIQSVCLGLIFGTGAFTSAVISKIGAGVVCTVGGLIAAIGCAGSAFVPNLATLIVTVGIITGIGLCTTTMVPFILAGQVFEKKRHFSLTVVGIGPGFGSLIFPTLNSFLVEQYGWRGSFLILSGIVLHTCPMGMVLSILCKELVAHKKKRQKMYIDAIENGQTVEDQVSNTDQPISLEHKTNNSCEHGYLNVGFESGEENGAALKSNRHAIEAYDSEYAEIHPNKISFNTDPTSSASAQDIPSKDSKPKRLVSFLHLDLLKDVSFLTLAICVFVIMSLLPSINFFFVDMVMSRGMDERSGSYLLSLIGMFSLGGRFLFLFAKPFIKIPMPTLFASTNLVLGMTILFLVYADSYTMMLGAVACYGFPFGVVGVSYPSLMFDIAGAERYAMAVGYTETISGIGGLVGGPIAGLLKDLTGTYDSVMFTAMGTSVLVSLSFYTIDIRRYRQRKAANAT